MKILINLFAVVIKGLTLCLNLEINNHNGFLNFVSLGWKKSFKTKNYEFISLKVR